MTGEAGSSGLTSFALLLEGLENLRAKGHLDTRRTDLLSISEVGRDELAHSRVIAWLLDPMGSHGLGSKVLHAILEEGWGPEAAAEAHLGVPGLEVTRLATRADVIVELGSSTLVIENKVDAPEQPTQCDDFFRHWGTRGRYLLISPSGGRPTSATLHESRQAWRTLSYGSFARLLEARVDEAVGPGQFAFKDYMETLLRQFPKRDSFVIGREEQVTDAQDRDTPQPVDYDAPDPFDTPRLSFYLNNHVAVADVAALQHEFRFELEAEVRRLFGPIQQYLRLVEGPVEGDLGSWNNGPKHLRYWRHDWTSQGTPVAAIGLAWDRLEPAREGLYVGLFVRNTASTRSLKDWLRQDQQEAKADDWVPGLYPIAYRYVRSKVDWWRDIPEWRASLADEVRAAWHRFAPRVDIALTTPGVRSEQVGP